MFALLPRLVFQELLRVSVLTFAGLSLIIMVGGAMLEASKRGVDPVKLMLLMPFLLPPSFPFLAPMSILFAVTLVFGRMSSGAEIIAVKAGGIHVVRLIVPALLLAGAVAGGLVWMTAEFIPANNARLTKWLLSDVRTGLYTYIRMNQGLHIPGFPYELAVARVQGDRLIQPTFTHRNAAGREDLIAQAAEATLSVGPAEEPGESELAVTITMFEVVARDGRDRNGITVRNAHQTFTMPLPPIAKQKEEKIENLTAAECEENANRLQDELFRKELDFAWDAFDVVTEGNPDQFVARTRYREFERERFVRKARESRGEVHLRLIQSLAVIPFVLLGFPLGILLERRDFLQTFFISFLPIIAIFYPMVVLSFNVFKEGLAPSPLVLWAPVVAMTLLAAPLLRRVAR